ncbi:hypothetical protein BKA69DRAFT_1085238 [Paraphysoderma sedebokerense]|nr:hypothetical protein BKA69DRAFT_1085238 [Paraphysoderma sedebokerense]
MFARSIVTLALVILATSAIAIPQTATPAPQVQDLGNGCFSVTVKKGGGSSSSTVCGKPGSGAPKVLDKGNGCFEVTMENFSSTMCAGTSGSAISSSSSSSSVIVKRDNSDAPVPQVQYLGNGCFSITVKTGGSSSSSTVCGAPGSGTPKVTDKGNGCFEVVLGGSTSSVCASSSGL